MCETLQLHPGTKYVPGPLIKMTQVYPSGNEIAFIVTNLLVYLSVPNCKDPTNCDPRNHISINEPPRNCILCNPRSACLCFLSLLASGLVLIHCHQIIQACVYFNIVCYLLHKCLDQLKKVKCCIFLITICSS